MSAWSVVLPQAQGQPTCLMGAWWWCLHGTAWPNCTTLVPKAAPGARATPEGLLTRLKVFIWAPVCDEICEWL